MFGEESVLEWDAYGLLRLFLGGGMLVSGVLLLQWRSRRERAPKLDWAILLRIAVLFSSALFWTGLSIPDWEAPYGIREDFKMMFVVLGWGGQGTAAFFLAARLNHYRGIWIVLCIFTGTTATTFIVLFPPRHRRPELAELQPPR